MPYPTRERSLLMLAKPAPIVEAALKIKEGAYLWAEANDEPRSPWRVSLYVDESAGDAQFAALTPIFRARIHLSHIPRRWLNPSRRVHQRFRHHASGFACTSSVWHPWL